MKHEKRLFSWFEMAVIHGFKFVYCSVRAMGKLVCGLFNLPAKIVRGVRR